MILVSACLIGVNCRYDGGHNLHPLLIKAMASGALIPVCPEQLGGLPTPRTPAEIRGGSGKDLLLSNTEADLGEDQTVRVLDRTGKNRTQEFLNGAKATAYIARAAGAQSAILKTRSPSCGCGQIYDGSFSGKLVAGDGVTTVQLKSMGIQIFTEEQITPALLKQLGIKTK